MKRIGKIFFIIASLYFLWFPDISMGAKTFKCTDGSFKDPINLNKDSEEGQCVKYVRYEIATDNDDHFDVCNGKAWTCYDDAKVADYAVGQKPKESAIIVFDADSTKRGLGVGHVGIVIGINGNMVTIRDSNWVAPFTVGEHTVDVSKYKINGYIYCDGETDDPYIYSSHAYTGSGEVQGGANTNYNYSLPLKKNQFTIGQTAKAIVRVENIKVRHRWLVEIWQSGVKQSDYAWSWNEVDSGWSASYFWPEQKINSAGNYQFKIYLYLGDDNWRDHIIDLNFTAVKPDNWQPYAYDGNGSTGYGPPEGGANTNWHYSLPRKTTTFSEGDHVYGLVRINDVYVNHRFKVKAYRDNLFIYEYEWDLNEVNANGGRWSTSYFWPELNNASVGNWEFRTYLEYDGKTILLSVLPFTVSRPANWQPYTYDGNGYTGHGPVQGGESADWRYWLSDKTKMVNEGDTLYGMLRLDQVKFDHRFKVETYRSGVKKWEWAMPDFNRVGSGWDYAHFYFGFNKVWPGDWRFDVLINTANHGQNSWQLIDSLYFAVNKKSQPPKSPSVRYDFNNHNSQGWTAGYDVVYTEQNQADKDTWMVIANGENPGVVSPELPPGFTTSKTPNLRFSVKIRGNVRDTYGQIWLIDSNGHWGYPTTFTPVKVDYNYYEYSINLAHLGHIPIKCFSIELTQDAPYEQWIFDWAQLK